MKRPTAEEEEEEDDDTCLEYWKAVRKWMYDKEIEEEASDQED